MVSTSRKISRKSSRFLKEISDIPADRDHMKKLLHKNMIDFKGEKKLKVQKLREDEKYDRLDKRITRELGTHYISNKPPHYWKCDCGAVTHGGMESRVDNAVVVRCRYCDSTTLREIKY